MSFRDAIFLFSLRNILLLCILTFALTWLEQIIRYRFLSPLRKFPGPFWASVTRLWTAYHSLKQDEIEVVTELHRKRGPVLRITPTMLLVSDASKLPDIYSRNANKSKHYITGSFGEHESIFNMQDSKVHARYRKIAAGPYAFSNIKKMEPLVDARMRHWITTLDERFAQTGAVFDFSHWAIYLAYDVISEIGFGAPLGFINAGSDVGGLIKGFHEGFPVFGVLSRLWPFTEWVKMTWLKGALVAKSTDKTGIGMVMRTRDKLLAERKKDIEEGKAGDRVDILQNYIDARDEDGKPLSDDHIKAEILLVLLAGADTTGTVFQSMMHYILPNSAIYAKVMAEIDANIASNNISGMPQYDEVLEHLPYYVACVKETIRLRPSAPGLFPRIVGRGGMVLEGKFVPEGTEVTCNPWLVHRDKKIFGEDAEEFRPERWLESEDQTRMLNKYIMTFGYGPRACLGKDIAMMELYKGPLLFLSTFRATMESQGVWVNRGGASTWLDMKMEICKREL